MSRLVCLPANTGPVLNAAQWLRRHLNLDKYENMEPHFEEYFRCRVVREPAHDLVYGRVYAVFEHEEDATMFVLRWG